MPHASQHTLRYKKEGDYGKERPYVLPVEYVGSTLFPGTCEKCVFGRGEHTDQCVTRKAKANGNN